MSETNDTIGTFMVYLEGKKSAFRCEMCGSNCFHKHDGETFGRQMYVCNGCGCSYVGETKESER